MSQLKSGCHSDYVQNPTADFQSNQTVRFPTNGNGRLKSNYDKVCIDPRHTVFLYFLQKIIMFDHYVYILNPFLTANASSNSLNDS